MAASVKRVNGIIIQIEKLDPVLCLGHCGQKFEPEYKGNRVCPLCTRQNDQMNGVEYSISRK